MLQKYAKHQPTGFDPAGAFLPEQQDWLLAPVSQTRDSGPLDLSNFAACLSMLGGESETVEVHRFGHWGPGWYEIILIDPADAERIQIAEGVAEALSDYPVIDEEDFSRREWEDYESGWEDYGREDFLRLLEKRFGLPDRAMDILEDAPSEELRELYEGGIPSGEYYIGEDSGVSINIRSWRREKAAVARFIREHKE